MKKFKLLTIFIIMALLSAVFTVPASAEPPVKSIVHVEYTEQIDGLCEFPVMLWHDLDIKLKEWFDENGVFIKGHQSWGQTREVYFTEISDRELKAHSQGPVHGEGVAPDEIILKYTGPSGMVIVPGHGPAMGHTGLLIVRLKLINGEWVFVEVIKSTNHFTYDEEDLQAFCSYLAGE